MSQLSSYSQHTINKIRTLLAHIENFIRFLRKLVFRKIPLFITNIAYLLQALKDIASFVPSYIYKSILALLLFAVIRHRVRKYLLSRTRKQQTIQKQSANHLSKSQIFNNLGQQFEVKQKIQETQVCEVVDQDSCCVDLNEQLQEPQDFRDIVFFQLMRGYRRSLSQKSKISSKELEKSM